mgnify:CR=1 FL=1
MNIPQTWTLAQLGSLTAQVVGGGTPSKTSAANFNGHIPFMTVKDLKARFVSSTVDHISEDALLSSAATKVPADTLIVATRMSLGKIARPTMDVAINQDLKALFLHSGVNKTFVEYFWRSKSHAIQSMGTGTTVKGIRLEDIRTLEVPLAPEAEQKRIADKLDTVLTRVDAVNTRLARVAPLLKRFRQSVLAAATSGRLTEDWRQKQGNKLQPWKACATKDAGRIQLGRQRSPKFHSGDSMHPYLRVQNVFEDRLDLSDVMTMDFPGEDFQRYRLHPGDILLNEGQSPEYLGRPAMYRGELPGACFTNTLIRFQAYPHVDAEFALIVFRHYMHSGRYLRAGTTTTNIAHLGAGRFGDIEFPLPGLEEQTEIVRRVETLFAFADRLEARLAQAQTAATRLTPALLAKAFRGELVPQDPNDEPAAELLRRLQAERASAPKASTGPGRKAAVQV